MTTAMARPEGEEPGRTETESRDSLLVEFTDAGIDTAPRPVRDVVLRHAPSWLRGAAAVPRPVPQPHNPVALAACLFEQARLLAELGRHAEAVPKVTEASQLYRSSGSPETADALHLAAEIHRALGDTARAIELLRQEEELRRKPAA